MFFWYRPVFWLFSQPCALALEQQERTKGIHADNPKQTCKKTAFPPQLSSSFWNRWPVGRGRCFPLLKKNKNKHVDLGNESLKSPQLPDMPNTPKRKCWAPLAGGFEGFFWMLFTSYFWCPAPKASIVYLLHWLAFLAHRPAGTACYVCIFVFSAHIGWVEEFVINFFSTMKLWSLVVSRVCFYTACLPDAEKPTSTKNSDVEAPLCIYWEAVQHIPATPPKFNIAPEKWQSEDHFSFWKVTFQGLC